MRGLFGRRPFRLNPAGGLEALDGTDDADRVDGRAAAAAKACFKGSWHHYATIWA